MPMEAQLYRPVLSRDTMWQDENNNSNINNKPWKNLAMLNIHR